MSKYVWLSKKVNGERLEHRVIWEQHNGKIPKGMQIHHINGLKNDNRISNLALLTDSQNKLKMDRAGKGYTVVKRKRPYKAKRLNKHLGYFGTPCGAYIASKMAFITNPTILIA